MREFGAIDLPIDQLVEKIGSQLGAVEEVIDVGAKYKGIVVAKVVSCVKHPDADKLHVCMIDDAGVTKGVKRNKDGLVQVVCGAPNVAEGLLVVWIPPGATVPATWGKDPFVLEAKELRGVVSNGMLASAKELAIGDSHEGLLVIKNDKPGTPLTKAFWLDDYVIDIENKMFTHRPDGFGQLGVAREVAGITGKKFTSPDWYKQDASLLNDGRKNVLEVKIKNDVPKLVPRFTAVAIKDVKVEPSPAWMQSFLSRVGIRPINNIVDITNFVMLETGQPLHAYDYDKVKTKTLGARLSQDGEQLKLLNGKDLKLKSGTVVITDGAKPIGLAGIMGGADTEVSANTKNIILECANFEMNQTRRTAMTYGIFTDAATRFTKGQSPLQNLAAIVRATNQITQIAGGRVASPVVDDNHAPKTFAAVKTPAEFINSRLGLTLSAAEMAKLLTNVEFAVKTTGDELVVTPPFWRTDIQIPEDLVEEVGRLYGYDHLPQNLPDHSIEPAKQNTELAIKSRIREILSAAGANEVLTYSFVHGDLMDKVGQDKSQAFKIKNSLSPDLQYYRLSLTPSLLEKVHGNIKEGFDSFALFEIGKIHSKQTLDPEGLPAEPNHLAVVVASKDAKTGAPYYWAKELCEYLLRELNIVASYEPLLKETSKKAVFYELPRTAEIKVGGKIIGRVGEFKPSVKQAFKLPKYCAGFSLHLDDVLPLVQEKNYQSLNRFPSVEQDLCLLTSADFNYQELTSFVSDQLSKASEPHGYQYTLKPLDIFQRANDKNHKQTTWRITLSHPERTLTTQETNKVLDSVAAAAKVKFKAERI